MYDTQTVEILRKLKKDEFKRFGDFVQSPFFNNSTFIVKIYDAAKMEYPHFTGTSLEPEKIFKKLYPSESFKDTRIRNLYAEFGNLLRKFLGYIKIESSEVELDSFIARALMEKDLNHISNKVIYKRFVEYKDRIFWDNIDFPLMYKMHALYSLNLDAGSKHSTKEYISVHIKLQELLIASFFRDNFSLLTTQSAQKIVFPDLYNKNTIEDFLNVIDIKKLFAYLENVKNPYSDYLKVNYLIYYYTGHDINEEDYIELKKMLYKIIFDVASTDAFQFIIRIIQILLLRLVPLDKKFYNEIFELSKLFCELKIFPNKRVLFLAAGPFRDMFGPAVILGELDWAESFVKEYSQYLMEDIRENELNYCMGNISFKRKNYELSLDYFGKVKMFDMIEKINIRFYYMMNYIELKAYESALSSLHTLKQFNNDRKDIPDIFAALIPDALKYFGEIIRCEMDEKKMDPQIYSEAKDGRRFYHVKYILGKMEKLKE